MLTQNWNSTRFQRYGSRLDIIYDDPGFYIAESTNKSTIGLARLAETYFSVEQEGRETQLTKDAPRETESMNLIARHKSKVARRFALRLTGTQSKFYKLPQS